MPGLMRPAGVAAFKLRKDDKSKVYSFENDPKQLDAELEQKFKAIALALSSINNSANTTIAKLEMVFFVRIDAPAGNSH